MTELSPNMTALKAELGRAIRRDHKRRERRHRAIRTTTLGVAACAALSGSALAAGDALGVIDLGGGSGATPVSTIPVWDSKTGAFVTATVGSSATAPYAYHISGGTTTTRCPFTNPPRYETYSNDIYVNSTRPLSAAELQQALEMQIHHTAANYQQLRSDGLKSMGSFDNPTGAGCGYGPGATPSTEKLPTSTATGRPTATQTNPTP